MYIDFYEFFFNNIHFALLSFVWILYYLCYVVVDFCLFVYFAILKFIDYILNSNSFPLKMHIHRSVQYLSHLYFKLIVLECFFFLHITSKHALNSSCFSLPIVSTQYLFNIPYTMANVINWRTTTLDFAHLKTSNLDYFMRICKYILSN